MKMTSRRHTPVAGVQSWATLGGRAAARPALSIIIPALDEAHAIGATLDAVSSIRGHVEVIVVDGGSRDETVEIARRAGARVLISAPGRGVQMHCGVRAARGAALWFLHADTTVSAEAGERIMAALGDAGVAGGNFRVRFDGTSRAARFMTWLYPQLRRLGLYYGDSAIFVRTSAYWRAGGFQPLPIFEDLDLVRRLERVGRMVHLPVAVNTSSRRFERRSFTLTFARWAALQVLYWLGVNPRRLGLLYAPVRAHTGGTSGAEL